MDVSVIPKIQRFKYESASAEVREYEDQTVLCALYSRDRGKGYATALMEKIERYAYENHITLYLEVRAYKSVRENDILTNDQLREFYRKFGFITIAPATRDSGEMMARPATLKPREKNEVYNERDEPNGSSS